MATPASIIPVRVIDERAAAERRAARVTARLLRNQIDEAQPGLYGWRDYEALRRLADELEGRAR